MPDRAPSAMCMVLKDVVSEETFMKSIGNISNCHR